MFVFNKSLELKFNHGFNFKEILNKAFSSNGKVISFVNPFSYPILARNASLISGVDFWFSDGALLCSLLNLTRKNKIIRKSFDFSSVAHELFTFAESNGYSISLIGGTDNEINSTVEYLKALYPNIIFSHVRNGFFNDNEVVEIAKTIESTGTDIIISGMGTPKQEEFLLAIRKYVKAKALITCGGFISQTAMRGDYYHPLIKRFGLRWLQRAVLHKHVRKRLIFDYPTFVLRYVLDVITIKLNL